VSVNVNLRPAARHQRVVVVCSALSTTSKKEGTTNRLLKAYKHCLDCEFNISGIIIRKIRTEHVTAAYDYIKTPHLAAELVKMIEHECDQVMELLQATRIIGLGTSYILDKVVSTGERLACFFIATALRDRGISAEAVDLSEIASPIANNALDYSFYDSLSGLMAKRIRNCQATVPVVTGFFGPIDRGVLSQIGRGYTDFCASIICMGLQAEELQVWKEVEGIFTADPSKVPSAKMLPVISSEEASELTFHGSEVVHYAAMRLAMRASVSVRIKNVLHPHAPGTLVVDDWNNTTSSPTLANTLESIPLHEQQDRMNDGDLEAPIAITSKDKIVLINIRSAGRLKAHSFLAGIFAVFDKWNLCIDLICTSEVQVSMAVHSEASMMGDEEGDFEPLRNDIKGAIAQLQDYGHVELLHKRTIVSLVGKQATRSLGVTGRMFSTLSENRIKVEMMAHGMNDTKFAFFSKRLLISLLRGQQDKCVVRYPRAGR
jgi:aspartate kinase